MSETADTRTTNWSRWGDADERGTLNLIDASAVMRGIAAVHRGEVLELGHVIGSARSPALEGRRAAIQHYMLRDGGDPDGAPARDFNYAEDVISLPVHGVTTHIDALSHGWTEGKLYNGYDRAEINSRGALRCGAEKLGGIVTRGFLLDIARYLGVGSLAVDHEITADELAAAADAANVVPQSGDALLVRTGWMAGGSRKPNDQPMNHPGIGDSAVDWLYEHDIALVGADTIGLELLPAPSGRVSPVHVRLLNDLGLPMLELLDLEQLAKKDEPAFCLVVAPLRIQGGTGSPVSPLAVL